MDFMVNYVLSKCRDGHYWSGRLASLYKQELWRSNQYNYSAQHDVHFSYLRCIKMIYSAVFYTFRIQKLVTMHVINNTKHN